MIPITLGCEPHHMGLLVIGKGDQRFVEGWGAREIHVHFTELKQTPLRVLQHPDRLPCARFVSPCRQESYGGFELNHEQQSRT